MMRRAWLRATGEARWAAGAAGEVAGEVAASCESRSRATEGGLKGKEIEVARAAARQEGQRRMGDSIEALL